MKFTETARKACNRALFSVKKNSPKILTGGAILFGIGTVVATWMAARKTDKALEAPKAIIAEAKAKEITEEYTEKDQQRDIRHGYAKGAAEIIKLYGPAALMGSFSIACVLGSYKILSARNAGLAMANGILTKEFNDYREKVIEKYGKDEDYQLRFGDKTEEVEETITDENGEEKTQIVKRPDKKYQKADLARVFDENSTAWSEDFTHRMHNLIYIRDDLERQLREHDGVLPLAAAYKAFGWKPTKASYQYGWVQRSGVYPTTHIDFGLPIDDPVWRNQMEMRWRENAYSYANTVDKRDLYFWIEFNCTELIYDDLPFEEV